MGDTRTITPFALKDHGSIAHSASPHELIVKYPRPLHLICRAFFSILFIQAKLAVTGRCIFSNLFQVRDVLDYIERTDESAILLNLDQEKTFDCSFFLSLLIAIAFGFVFCRWTPTFF